jgi:NAD-dependent dihydropyrimidine dehydrogenase PreA subunit
VLDAGLNPLESGTPKVIPKRMPCWLCMRCGPACPTGALAPVEKTKAGMGTAVIDRKRCFTYMGHIICRTCFEKCPLKAKAIELELALYPVITKECVGCGVCENVCPAQCIDTLPPGSAITPEEPVDPSQLDKKAAWGPECAPRRGALAEAGGATPGDAAASGDARARAAGTASAGANATVRMGAADPARPGRAGILGLLGKVVAG